MRENYLITEVNLARADMRKAFNAPFAKFYNPFATKICKSLKIDILEFDKYLHKEHGDYEMDGKSMEGIILEKYGNEALEIFNRLV